MGLFRRNKQATERVQDLKNRVESLRKVDDEHRALTLDDFLAGDDAVTARTEPRFTPAPTPPAPPPPSAQDDLEAELQRYLLAHADEEEVETPEPEFKQSAPGLEPAAHSDETITGMRPISIDEFPPLPPPDRVEVKPAASPPRLSAEEEAALIAELQRFLQTDNTESSDATVSEPVAYEPEQTVAASEWLDVEPIESAAPESAGGLGSAESPAELFGWTDDSEAGAEAETNIVELRGRTYEEPKPRHWPSVPLDPEQDDSSDESGTPPRPGPRAVGDWEPL